jgi:hypothetical protein
MGSLRLRYNPASRTRNSAHCVGPETGKGGKDSGNREKNAFSGEPYDTSGRDKQDPDDEESFSSHCGKS